MAVRYRTDAYRTVYAARIDTDIWVVHAFRKKSTKGIKTQRQDVELIRARLNRLRKELKQ